MQINSICTSSNIWIREISFEARQAPFCITVCNLKTSLKIVRFRKISVTEIEKLKLPICNFCKPSGRFSKISMEVIEDKHRFNWHSYLECVYHSERAAFTTLSGQSSGVTIYGAEESSVKSNTQNRRLTVLKMLQFVHRCSIGPIRIPIVIDTGL